MNIVNYLDESLKKQFDKLASHIIQSWAWGDFRKKTGVGVERIGFFKNGKLASAYQITFHKIPFTNFTVAYLPKSKVPEKQVLNFLLDVGKKHNAIFIKLEPNVTKEDPEAKRVKELLLYKNIIQSPKSIFATQTFLIDLTKSEDELLAAMHHKTRYNIKLAQRRGVKVKEASSSKSFEIFIKLQRETAARQKFFVHPDSYYRKMWQTLKPEGLVHLILAKYKGKVLSAWILFKFGKILYYPYGGSAERHKNLMASNLLAWEAIRLGQRLGCTVFDFWGALGENPDVNDPWYGFHRFKVGYGGKLVEYVGTFDLVINGPLYYLFIFVDKLRWFVLHILRIFA